MNATSLGCARAAGLIVLAGAVGVAHADVYLDFGVHFGVVPSTYAASAPSPGHWNEIGALGLTPGLLNADGTSTGVSVTLSASDPDGWVPGLTDDFGTLVNDNFFAVTGAAWSVVITGLDAGAYDVYYYETLNSTVSTGAFTVNGVAAIPISATSADPAPVQGVNWEVLSGVASTDGTMTLASSTTDGFRGLAGVQIVRAVPSPSGVLVLALPVAAWARRRR